MTTTKAGQSKHFFIYTNETVGGPKRLRLLKTDRAGKFARADRRRSKYERLWYGRIYKLVEEKGTTIGHWVNAPEGNVFNKKEVYGFKPAPTEVL